MRYFFNIRQTDGVILDEEGGEFADLYEAHTSALAAVRELAAAKIKSGQAIPDQHMEVRDEDNASRVKLSFHEVVQALLKR